MSVTEPRGNGETVLVTGGSGFLGGWCLIEALRRGYRVRTTVRSLSREPQVRAMLGGEIDAGDRLSFAAADLTADAGWAEAVSGCDYGPGLDNVCERGTDPIPWTDRVASVTVTKSGYATQTITNIAARYAGCGHPGPFPEPQKVSVELHHD